MDQNEFRQADAAIILQFVQLGAKGLANDETPIRCSSLSMPFEFAFYSCLESWFAKASPSSLKGAGRVISTVFGFLCIFSAMGLMLAFLPKRLVVIASWSRASVRPYVFIGIGV